MSMKQRAGIGVQDLVWAPLTESSDVLGGTPSYGTVVPLAGLAKLTVKVNGTVASDWADDELFASATAVGKIQVDLEMLDVVPSTLAAILGQTYANGATVDNFLDTAPYGALGYKQWLRGLDANGNRVYRYKWLLKGVLAKPDEGGQTKQDAIKYEHMSLKGEFCGLAANKNYQYTVRTDDPNVPSATLTNFFNQPLTSTTADASALTVTMSNSSGALKLVFAKGSGASFSMNEGSLIPGKTFLVTDNGTDVSLAGTGVWSNEASTGPTYTFTPTVAFGTDSVVGVVTADIQDAFGVGVTPKASTIVF